MEAKKFGTLSCAEKARILSDVTSRLVEHMSRRLCMLGGERLPELVVQLDGKPFDLRVSEDLYTAMDAVKESLERVDQPVGFVFDSVDGFVREPYTHGDEAQTQLLAKYDVARAESPAKTPA